MEPEKSGKTSEVPVTLTAVKAAAPAKRLEANNDIVVGKGSE